MTRNIVRQKSKKSKHKIIGTPVHTSRGKVIGQVIGDVFVKDMTTAHILDKFNAIASDISTLHEAEHAGALYVEFTNTDDGVIYRASIAKFWDCGKFFNFGYGDQQMLGLVHFEHKRDPNHESHTDGTHDVKPLVYKSHAVTGVVWNGVKQLSLFKGGDA